MHVTHSLRVRQQEVEPVETQRRISPKAWCNPVQWKGEGKWRSSSEKTLLSWVPLHSSSLFAHQRRARHGLTVSIHASGTPIPTVIDSYTTPSRPLSTRVGFILCDATALAHTRRVQPASGPPHWRRHPKRRSTSPAPRPHGNSRQTIGFTRRSNGSTGGRGYIDAIVDVPWFVFKWANGAYAAAVQWVADRRQPV